MNSINLNHTDIINIKRVRKNYLSFIDKCTNDYVNYSFLIDGVKSPFARCFALFGFNLIDKLSSINSLNDELETLIINDLNIYLSQRSKFSKNIALDKPFLQLLTFSLSALNILNKLKPRPFEEIVKKILENDIFEILKYKGFHKGMPQSGNFSMFYAILFEYSRLYLDYDSDNLINKWIEIHLKNLNSFGFWGKFSKITHLQFQNGYHQYAMLDYFKVRKFDENLLANNIISLMDRDGLFAPYPGGGGCFDYDAIYLISKADKKLLFDNKIKLLKLLRSIFNLQNKDGGFSESQNIRPRNITNFNKFIFHIVNSPNVSSKFENFKYFISLYRNKHNKIKNHWIKEGYDWGTSNLWDSWFRVMTIANIEMKVNKSNFKWNAINFPGIGYII